MATKKIDSQFAIVSIKGRAECAAYAERYKDKVPVIFRGTLSNPWSKFDGIDQEFNVTVNHAVETTEYIDVGGEHYDRAKSLELRNHAIQLRDTALSAGHMEWSVILSHLIAWMAQAIDERWPE